MTLDLDVPGAAAAAATADPVFAQEGSGRCDAKDEQRLLKPHSSSPGVLEALRELEKKYAPYGTMGRGELPALEKVLLGIAFVTLVPIRLVAGVLVLVVYYLICRLCTLCSVPKREVGEEDYAHIVGWRREVIVACGRFLSRVMVFVFGFYWIHVHDRSFSTSEDENAERYDEEKRPGAIVSKHVSYVDILHHMSSSFPSFVAKRSVAKLPLVGLISKCLGCIYVQRESRYSDFKGVSAVVTERVPRG